MKIGIVGAGNIGTALAADIARSHEVRLYSSKPKCFERDILYIESTGSEKYSSQLYLVSDDYADVVNGADLIFVCLPTFLIRKASDSIAKNLKKNTPVCFVPGAGGIEFLSRSLVERGCPIAGLERVPYVARLVEYGKCVSASKKTKARIAFFRDETEGLFDMITEVLGMQTTRMRGFISVSLTPTLHVSRLYDLYSEMGRVEYLDENPLFYGDWRDSASLICLELDSELHQVCDALCKSGIDASELVPYTIHYESPTYYDLTAKLRSIKSLATIRGPVAKKDGKYILDVDSRYFTESFPFRLALVKGLADIVGVSVPLSDKVLAWYAKIANKNYYVKGDFIGKDVCECSCPQNFGIANLTDLVTYYSQKTKEGQ